MKPLTPELKARQQIDAQLAAAVWIAQDLSELDLSSSHGIAVREMQSQGGPADYILFSLSKSQSGREYGRFEFS